MTKEELANVLDHSLVQRMLSDQAAAYACRAAGEHGLAGVSVFPMHVPLVAPRLEGTGVATIAVCGLFSGDTLPGEKAAEAFAAVRGGATEIELVLPLNILARADATSIVREVSLTRQAIGADAILRVVLWTGLLSLEQKKLAAHAAIQAGADALQTSLDCLEVAERIGVVFATLEDVRILRRAAAASGGAKIGVKAAGGIGDLATARAMLNAGATRIGSSNSFTILEQCGED